MQVKWYALCNDNFSYTFQGSFLQRWTPIMISVGSSISSFMWDVLIHPCPNRNGDAVDVLIQPCHNYSKHRTEKVDLAVVHWSLTHCNDVTWAQHMGWQQTKHKRSATPSLCPLATGGLPSLKASNTESVTMSVRLQVVSLLYHLEQRGQVVHGLRNNWHQECICR